jgi:cytochrome c-type biogenesis protein CcmH/NrfG
MERAARLLGNGHRDDAEQILVGLLNQDPDDVVAWFLLGEVLLQRGERIQARLAFQRASSSTPRDVESIDGQAVAWAAKLRVQALEKT